MEGWTGNADDMTLVISPTARLGQTDERSNWELDTWMPMFCGLVTCGYIAAIQQGDGYLLLLGSRDCLWGGQVAGGASCHGRHVSVTGGSIPRCRVGSGDITTGLLSLVSCQSCK